MALVRTLQAVCIGLAAALAGAGYVLAGRALWVVPVVGLAAVWVVGVRRGWSWSASLGLVGMACAAAGGMMLGAAAGWMLASVIAALFAWDLNAHALWVEGLPDVAKARQLTLRHLGRLLLIGGMAVLLGAVALSIRLRANLPVMMLLGLMAVAGIARALRFMASRSER